jgi:putative DNA-invertase from lambdoid prophage Rac
MNRIRGKKTPRAKGVIMIGIYLRVSTNKQEVASQKHAIERWIMSMNYPQAEIVWYQDSGISGKTLSRPAFQRMLADVEMGKIHKIITFEISRLSRNFLDLLKVMETLTLRGCVVEVPGEGEVAFQDTMSQFITAAKALTAATERERISARTKEGLAKAKAAGKQLGAREGEQRALGYRKDYAAKEPKLLERVLLLHRKGLSIANIAATVTDDQGRTVSTNKVHRLIRRYAKPQNAVT